MEPLQRTVELTRHLAGCLALHSRKRDFALGIDWTGQRTRGYLWYYNYLAGKQLATTLTLDIIRQERDELVKRVEAGGDKAEITKRLEELAGIARGVRGGA